MTTWQRRAWVALWPLGAVVVVLGDLGWWIHGVEPRETYVLDVAVGASAITGGLLVWARQPRNLIGPLLVLSGFLWALGGIRGFQTPYAAVVGDALSFTPDLVLAHLLLAYPTGRLGSPWIRGLVAAGYGIVALNVVKVTTLATTTVGTENPVALWNAPNVHDRLDTVTLSAAAAYALTGIVVLFSRWLRASTAGRYVYSPVLGAALAFALAALFETTADAVTGSEPRWSALPAVLMRVVIPFAFLYGLLRSRVDRFGVGDLVARLGVGPRDSLREALARTLHDPALQLAYWSTARAAYVDSEGKVVALPVEGSHQVATLIERGGEPLAAIVHDRALHEDTRLIEAVSATTRLLLENESLQAEVQAQLEAARASRARLVEAGDAERRRVERDLHDGAQQRLVTLSLALGLAREQATSNGNSALSESLAEAAEEAARALAELRELGRGLHPTILSEAGLGAALESLAERSSVPTAVIAVPAERLPQAVERAAYFIASEALANVSKHANASRIQLGARRENSKLVLEITDDGIGGADPARGSGLTGLEDRAAALGGRLWIESPPGGGTRVLAEIPCG
jgi:signal transduction histidine kinase